MAALTQTGARLIHDGQLQGRRVRLPVFLGRFPAEPVDDGIAGVLPITAVGHGRSDVPGRALGIV